MTEYKLKLEPYFMKLNDKYIGYIKTCVSTDIIKQNQIILIIDISGSMQGIRINNVKESYKQLLNKINNQEIYITLILFNHESQIIYENVLINNDNLFDTINLGTSKMISSGGTKIIPAIKLALSKKIKEYNTHIIIFTDGEDNENKNLLYDMFSNETLHVCGIGSNSIKLINDLSKVAKMKTINIIDNLETINIIINNLLEYIKTNISDNIIINNKYYQLLNNIPKNFPLEPMETIDNYNIILTINSTSKTIICNTTNIHTFKYECIHSELERLYCNFNEEISVSINNNFNNINTIIETFEIYLNLLVNICTINDYNILNINEYNKLLYEINQTKELIIRNEQEILNINILDDITNRNISRALTVRATSLI